MSLAGSSPATVADDTLRSKSAWVAVTEFEEAGAFHASEDDETDDELDGYAKSLCVWLQGSGLLAEDGLVPRVTPRSLADLECIAQAVLAISPSMYDSQVRAHGEAVSPEIVVAACLDAGFLATHGAEIVAAEMLSKALRAGEQGLEPLSAIIGLWRYILTYAVSCDEKQQHIDSLQKLPGDAPRDMMNLIKKAQQRLDKRAESLHRTSRATLSPRPSASRAARLSQDGASDAAEQTPLHADAAAGEGLASSTMQALAAENARLRTRVAELEVTRRADDRRSARVLDGEFEAYGESWELKKLLQQKNDEIADLFQQVRAGRQAVEERDELKAELEVLRAQEQELATVRARLARSNERLEEVGELKVELQKNRERVKNVTGERDDLLQELGRLNGVGQQMDAWKAKVHDLELVCKERQDAQRVAEARAREAEECQEHLEGEKAILKEQLLEANKRCAELSECGPGGPSAEIVEPFTAELRERMQQLETRNEVLEKEVTEKGAQRVAELTVEVESQTNLRQHFEEQHREASDGLAACEARLTESEEKLANAEARAGKLDEDLAERSGELSRICETLATVEVEKEGLRSDLEQKQATLVAARKRIEHLEEEHVEAEHLQAELDAARAEGEALREHAREKAKEYGALQASAEGLGSRVVLLEREDRRQKRRVEQLEDEVERLQQAARKRSALEDGDRIWVQRQRALESSLVDLRAGLADQARHSDGMREEAEVAELRCRQLQDLLRRVAPEEYEHFLDRIAFAHAAPPAPGAEYELAQATAEIRRLQAALHEQRLRLAEESQELAKMSTELWHLQRDPEGVVGSGVGIRGNLDVDDEVQPSGDFDLEERLPAKAGAGAGFPALDERRVGGHSPGPSPRMIRPAISDAGNTRQDGGGGGGGARAIRNSILKKPRSMEAALPIEPLKENRASAFDYTASSDSRRTTQVGRPVPPRPRRGLIV